MHKPFDATLNELLDARPEEWASHFAGMLGIPAGPCEPMDTDLSTSVQSDRVFLIKGPSPAILHFELEANGRLGIPKEMLRYNVLKAHNFDIPVLSLLILLRRSALASDMKGVYRLFDNSGRLILEFHYHIEKVWKRPVDYWLNAGPGLAPLALLTDEAEDNLNEAVARLKGSLDERGTSQDDLRDVFGSSYILGGLRYSRQRLIEVFGRYSMLLEESTTYQYLIEKGFEKGIEKGIEKGLEKGKEKEATAAQALRKSVVFQGSLNFGPPESGELTALQRINDVDQLALVLERIPKVGSWLELLRN